MTVLVMGATGNVGAEVLAALVRRGARVRAVSRREQGWPDGVEGVVADPSLEHGLDDVAADVDGVFMLSGYAAEAGLLASHRRPRRTALGQLVVAR